METKKLFNAQAPKIPGTLSLLVFFTNRFLLSKYTASHPAASEDTGGKNWKAQRAGNICNPGPQVSPQPQRGGNPAGRPLLAFFTNKFPFFKYTAPHTASRGRHQLGEKNPCICN